ncbi:hypothetical protein OpiT1DRAFT_03809 [Opitutaceae bacterium TAV1]|nr:hypothetical protein OpiT1DRAFT_03809 [Opitutaceae bacterium TAV1]
MSEAIASPADTPPPASDVNADTEAPAGFRLQAVEICNWGTFHGDQHYEIELDGRSACLTGLNGSGKSTVIDAILTLLVPYEFRHYNVAATGSGAKRERSLRTYILGAYGKEESPESSRGQTRFLRKPGTVSILLAVFRDASFQRSVTLAQLHWVTASGEHQGRYLVKEGEARIPDLGIAGLSVNAYAEHLKKLGWSYDTTFDPYLGKFSGLLRIPTQQALKLFCRTVSVKDVPSVTEFIRSLMLEPFPVAKMLEDVETHFADLDHIHTQLEDTKKEIRLLTPVKTHHATYAAAAGEAGRLADLSRAARVVMARDASVVLDQAIAEQEQTRTGHLATAERLLGDLKKIDDTILSTKLALAQNKTFVALADLRKQEADLSSELGRARTTRTAYETWLRALGREATVGSPEEFARVRSWARGESSEQDSRQQRLLKDSGIKEAEALGVRQRATTLSEEIQSLDGRRDKIPKEHRDMRRQICEQLQIGEAALPFAGELLDVSGHEVEWRPSLEVLLHGFALSVLVPEDHYRRFSAYVDKSEFRRRLVYFQVPKGTGANVTLDSTKAYGKIVIKPDAWCRGWLQARLFDDFPHHCAETMEEFWQVRGPALTRNRHIRGGARHTKETTHGARDFDLLGWSNEAKIAELRSRLTHLQGEARDLDAQAQKLEAQAKSLKGGVELLRKLTEVPEYRAIDVLGIEAELMAATQRREELEKADGALQALNAALAEAELERANVSQQRDQENIAAGKLEEAIKELRRRRGEFVRVVNAAATDDFPWQEHEAEVAAYREQGQLTLRGLEQQTKAVVEKIEEAFGKARREAEAAEKLLLPAMASFLDATKDKGYSADWSPVAGCAPALVAHMNRLVEEKFHDQEQEFNTMMRTVLLKELQVGDQGLKAKIRANQARIEELNQTLRDLPYNEDTIVQIVSRPSKEHTVLTYRAKLEDCTRHVIAMTDAQLLERFNAVKALVTYIREHRSEAEKGANPNHWDTFAIAEIRPEAPEEDPVNWFTDSDGNSGGQKAKLACTILAAAMAFQLNHTRNKHSNAFRLVMVDEIFAKSDDVNSAYALSIFEKFDFQLLLVTPRDGRLKLVQPYVGSFHLVQNPTTMASTITSVTRVELEKAAATTEDDGNP